MLELAAGWAEVSHPVAVTLGEPGPLEGELTRRGVTTEVSPLPVLRGELKRPRLFARFLSLAFRDVVGGVVDRVRGAGSARYISTLTLPTQVLSARIAGRYTVLHVHEAEISRPRWVRAVLSASALGAHRVIANSAFTRDVLLDSWPHLRGRIQVIHNPVPEPLRPAPSLPRERPAEFELLYVGRLSARKGVDIAIEATLELRRRGVPARLTVVGSTFRGNEEFEHYLKELSTKLRTADAIRFTGFVSDVGSFVANSHVVLVPSRKEESYGNVAVEAVLAERFVAVADHSGLREATEGLSAALRVRGDGPVNWADALEHLWGQWAVLHTALRADRRVMSEKHDPATLCERSASLVFALA